MSESSGDHLANLLGADYAAFARIEDQLPSVADALAESYEDDPLGLDDDDLFGAEPETDAARGLAEKTLRAHGIRAGEALQATLDRIEVVRDRLGADPDLRERAERVAGVLAEALSFVDEAAVAVDDDDDLPVHAPGWRPSDLRAAVEAADEPPAMMGDDQC